MLCTHSKTRKPPFLKQTKQQGVSEWANFGKSSVKTAFLMQEAW